MLIGWLECYGQKYIAYFLHIYSCGIEYLLIQNFHCRKLKISAVRKVTLSFLYLLSKGQAEEKG